MIQNRKRPIGECVFWETRVVRCFSVLLLSFSLLSLASSYHADSEHFKLGGLTLQFLVIPRPSLLFAKIT